MRGRTNLPPRMGGIVNGVVTECVVSEADGIDIGDYVQLVEGTGARDTSMEICNSDWMYGPFVLSDGTIASIYCDHSTNVPQVRQTTVDISGFVVESQITVLDVSGLGSPQPSSTSYDNMYVLELEQNKFLLQISRASLGGFAIIQYNGSSWTVTPLTTSNFTIPSEPYYLGDAKMCKISSTKVAFAYRSTLYIAQLSGTTLTFGSVTTITAGSKICSFMEYINGYLLISWLGEQLTAYSVSGTSSTAVSSLKLTENPTRFNTARLTSNKLLMLKGSNRTSYLTNPNGYVYATIITVNSDGTMSYVKNTTALPYDITYSYSSLIDQACPYVFEDGRILAIALLRVRSGSISSYSYRFASVWTSIGEYDANTNTVEFPSLELFDSSGFNSDNSFGEKEFFLSPIEADESGLMYFVAGGSGDGFRSTYQFILKVEQTTIVALSELPIVKKYVSRINGVAKTAGANGSVIEVYAPSSIL